MSDGENPDVFAEVHEDQRIRKARKKCPANHQVCGQIKQARK